VHLLLGVADVGKVVPLATILALFPERRAVLGLTMPCFLAAVSADPWLIARAAAMLDRLLRAGRLLLFRLLRFELSSVGVMADPVHIALREGSPLSQIRDMGFRTSRELFGHESYPER